MIGGGLAGALGGRGLLLADPFPSDDGGFSSATVSPGLPGFLAMFVLAVVVVLLVLDMTRRTRRVRVRAEARERVDAEYAAKAEKAKSEKAEAATTEDAESDEPEPDAAEGARDAGSPEGTASQGAASQDVDQDAGVGSTTEDEDPYDPEERSSLEDPDGAEDFPSSHGGSSGEHGTTLEDDPEDDDRP